MNEQLEFSLYSTKHIILNETDLWISITLIIDYNYIYTETSIDIYCQCYIYFQYVYVKRQLKENVVLDLYKGKSIEQERLAPCSVLFFFFFFTLLDEIAAMWLNNLF